MTQQTETIYRYIETKCKKCHVVDGVLTDNMTIKVGQTWDQECTIQGCKGESVVTETNQDFTKIWAECKVDQILAKETAKQILKEMEEYDEKSFNEIIATQTKESKK